MAERETHVRAPLFDRLVDRDLTPVDPRPLRGHRYDDPPAPEKVDRESRSKARPLRSLTPVELKESVRRELERLLSTRTSLPVRQLEKRELTVIDYGIPDFSTYSDANQADWKRLEKVLARVVATFEPRLRQVRVTVESYRTQTQRLRARIDAVLVGERIAEPVSFPAVIEAQEGESEVGTAT